MTQLMKHNFPTEKKSLSAAVKGRIESVGFRVENVIFRSRPRYPVTANMYIPEGAENCPALLFVGGSAPEGKFDKNCRRLAAELVSCGMVVLVMDSAGQGERSLFTDVAASDGIAGNPERERELLAAQMKLVGESFVDWALWDIIRAIDFLESHSEVDPEKICVAEGQGGTACSLLSEVETRPLAIISEKLEENPENAPFFFSSLLDMDLVAAKRKISADIVPEQLQCTPAGAIARLDGQIMLFDFIRAEADEYRVRRPEFSKASLREMVAEMLNISVNASVPVNGICGNIDGCEKVLLKISAGESGESNENDFSGNEKIIELEVDDAEEGTKKILQSVKFWVSVGCERIDLSAYGYAAIPALFAALLSDDVENILLENAPESFDSMLRKRIISVPAAFMPYGVLKITDIPQLVELVGAKIVK